MDLLKSNHFPGFCLQTRSGLTAWVVFSLNRAGQRQFVGTAIFFPENHVSEKKKDFKTKIFAHSHACKQNIPAAWG